MKKGRYYNNKGIYEGNKHGLNYYKSKEGMYIEQSILSFFKEHPLTLFSLVLSGSSLVLSFLVLILN